MKCGLFFLCYFVLLLLHKGLDWILKHLYILINMMWITLWLLHQFSIKFDKLTFSLRTCHRTYLWDDLIDLLWIFISQEWQSLFVTKHLKLLQLINLDLMLFLNLLTIISYFKKLLGTRSKTNHSIRTCHPLGFDFDDVLICFPFELW